MAIAAAGQAAPIPVGTGDNHATVVVNWKDGVIREFDVAFPGASITGIEAFDIIEADTTLTTVREDFGFGEFLDGITYGSSSNVGYGGGDDWWHYWIKDEGETDWTSPMFGASMRTLFSGDTDGWVYGSGAAPQVPEPATVLLVLAGGGILAARRRQSC